MLTISWTSRRCSGFRSPTRRAPIVGLVERHHRRRRPSLQGLGGSSAHRHAEPCSPDCCVQSRPIGIQGRRRRSHQHSRRFRHSARRAGTSFRRRPQAAPPCTGPSEQRGQNLLLRGCSCARPRAPSRRRRGLAPAPAGAGTRGALPPANKYIPAVRRPGRGQDHDDDLQLHRVRGSMDPAIAGQHVHPGLNPLTRLSPGASQPSRPSAAPPPPAPSGWCVAARHIAAAVNPGRVGGEPPVDDTVSLNSLSSSRRGSPAAVIVDFMTDNVLSFGQCVVNICDGGSTRALT